MCTALIDRAALRNDKFGPEWFSECRNAAGTFLFIVVAYVTGIATHRFDLFWHMLRFQRGMLIKDIMECECVNYCIGREFFALIIFALSIFDRYFEIIAPPSG